MSTSETSPNDKKANISLFLCMCVRVVVRACVITLVKRDWLLTNADSTAVQFHPRRTDTGGTKQRLHAEVAASQITVITLIIICKMHTSSTHGHFGSFWHGFTMRIHFNLDDKTRIIRAQKKWSTLKYVTSQKCPEKLQHSYNCVPFTSVTAASH